MVCDCKKGSNVGSKLFRESGLKKLLCYLLITYLFFNKITKIIKFDKRIKTVRGENQGMGNGDFHSVKSLKKMFILIEHSGKKGKPPRFSSQRTCTHLGKFSVRIESTRIKINNYAPLSPQTLFF